jgi:hypothetical protein
MKASFLFSLGLLTFSMGSDVLLEKRQSLALIANLVPAIKPTIIEASPQLRPTAKRRLLQFGPFTLPPNKVN